LGLEEASSAIIPWIIGGESEAMDVSAQLLDAGLLVPAIRYPTVAKGSARLRVALTAKHSPENIQTLAAELAKISPADTPRLQTR
jgi:7-keto-8-aminopelargonate synthetase-like enzyme